MLRKVLILKAVVLLALSCELQADVINSRWVGGDEGLWGVADNWEPAIVPDNTPWRTFVVTIDNESEVDVELRQDRTINRLRCYSSFELENESTSWLKLTIIELDGLTNYGAIQMRTWHEGLLTISGNLTNNSGASLCLGYMTFRGRLYNLDEGEVQINGPVETDLINNAGTIIIDSSGDLWAEENPLHNTGRIQLLGGKCWTEAADFENEKNGVIIGFGQVYNYEMAELSIPAQVIQNQGTVWAKGGVLSLRSSGSIANTGTFRNDVGAILHIQSSMIQASVADVNNKGNIEVNATGAITFNSHLINKPNGVITLLDGTLAAPRVTQSANATFTGFGGISGNLIIDPEGIIKLTGPTNIVGDVTINDGAVLEISDGQVLITGHTTCNGTIHMKGGSIIPQGGLSGDCNVVSESSIYSNIIDIGRNGTAGFRNIAIVADIWLKQPSWQ